VLVSKSVHAFGTRPALNSCKHLGVTPERVMHRLPALHPHLDGVAVSHYRPEQLLRCAIRLAMPSNRQQALA
jgi:hypothetical protein